MSAFWREEAAEPQHKTIKKALLKKAGKDEKGSKHPKHDKDPKHKEHKHGTPFKGDREKNPKVKNFIKKRMEDFKKGDMHSRVKGTGPKVTNPKQAIAISLSEAREKGAKIPKKSKK